MPNPVTAFICSCCCGVTQLNDYNDEIFVISNFSNEAAELATIGKSGVGDDALIAQDIMQHPTWRDHKKYPQNYIKTAKYTLLSFIPLTLFYQFKKLANLTFLVQAALAQIPGASPFDPMTSMVPLIFVVGVGMIKEGYEDYQRHKLDTAANSLPVRAIRCKSRDPNNKNANKSSSTSSSSTSKLRLIICRNEELVAGDIVLVKSGEQIPADLLILATSDRGEGTAFIETSNLDGETNVKTKKAPTFSNQRYHAPLQSGDPLLQIPHSDLVSVAESRRSAGGGSAQHVVEDDALRSILAAIAGTSQTIRHFPKRFNDDDSIGAAKQTMTKNASHDGSSMYVLRTTCPDAHLHSWTGVLESVHAEATTTCAVGYDQFLPRSSGLRNTDWIVGMVVYAGVDTKMFRNLQPRPQKLGYLDEKVNYLVIVLCVVWFIMITVLSTLSITWGRGEGRNHWYLHDFLIEDARSGKEVYFPIISFYILLSYMVPISLFVSLELLKVVQVMYMRVDVKMACRRSEIVKTPGGSDSADDNEKPTNDWVFCNPNTSNLNEELALVQHIFTDKTGTLTENVMEFKAGIVLVCGSASKNANPDDNNNPSPVSSIVVTEGSFGGGKTSSSSSSPPPVEALSYLRALALCHVIQPFLSAPGHDAASTTVDHPSDMSEVGGGSETGNTSSSLAFVTYEGPSPDEVALVRFAAGEGVSLVERTSQSMTLKESRIFHTKHNHQQHRPEPLSAYGSADSLNLESDPQENPTLPTVQNTTTTTTQHFGLQDDDLPTRTTSFAIHATLPFSADRKMMSILLQERNTQTGALVGKPFLITKGADSFVAKRLRGASNNTCTSGNNTTTTKAPSLEAIEGPLCELAAKGLRTLFVCTREIDSVENMELWLKRFAEASETMGGAGDREVAIDRVCLEMEKDLTLIGATAIEDKLQDGVPETLQFFLEAGVRIWMLTGDKRETAVTIAGSATLANLRKDLVCHIEVGDNLIYTEDSEQKSQQQQDVNHDFSSGRLVVELPTEMAEMVQIDHSHDEHAIDLSAPLMRCTISVVRKQLMAVKSAVERCVGGQRVLMVLDGTALDFCLSPDLFDLFLEISQVVHAAVGCRLTPLQKAKVVKLFQDGTKCSALAIGDGSNDVSMLMEARVGVGIVGLEGAQAARSADFAIPRFKHLKRLCAVHGRYALYRNSTAILVSSYKNIILSTCIFYFSLYTGYSGYSNYDGWLLTFFNVVFTSFPPLALGFWDKDVPEWLLESKPKLFTPLARDKLYFSGLDVAKWVIEALVHSVLIFFVMLPLMERQDIGGRGINQGRRMDAGMVGTIQIVSMLCMTLTRMAIETRGWQWLTAVLGYGLSIFGLLLFLIVMSAMGMGSTDTSFTNSFFILIGVNSSGIFWFCLLLFSVGVVVVVDVPIIAARKMWWPAAKDIAMQEAYAKGDADKKSN